MISVSRRVAVLPAFFVFWCTGNLPAWQAATAPASLSRKAKQFMEEGKFEQAIPLYRDLLKSNPGNDGMLLNFALAQHMAGQEREAVTNFEAVLKRNPRSLPALVSLGAARLALNDPKNAIAPLSKAIAVEPGNRDARGMLAGALMDQGRFAQASEQYRALAEASPEDPRAWYGLGMSYQNMAVEAFGKLQQINTTSPYVAALVADTRVQRHQFRSAFFFYNEAAKALPQLHGIHAAVAEVYRKTGHSDWAAQEDAKERALSPPDCKAHPAECQFLGGHDLEAATPHSRTTKPSEEELFWQAKAANELALQAFFRLGQLPESMELHRFRAELARNQGQHLESVKEWRAALAMVPGSNGLRQELATSLFMAQDYRAAIAEAEALLRSGGANSAELNFIVGDSWVRLEEPAKAVPYLNKALQIDPKMLAADASLGLALVRLDKNKEAAGYLGRALELDDDGSLHYQYARACQANGDTARAAEAMAQYRDILKRSEQQKEDVAREAQIVPPR